ncbi:hypothetical protein B0H13DRAFT_2513947, partial [Mycena leptocephala]
GVNAFSLPIGRPPLLGFFAPPTYKGHISLPGGLLWEAMAEAWRPFELRTPAHPPPGNRRAFTTFRPETMLLLLPLSRSSSLLVVFCIVITPSPHPPRFSFMLKFTPRQRLQLQRGSSLSFRLNTGQDRSRACPASILPPFSPSPPIQLFSHTLSRSKTNPPRPKQSSFPCLHGTMLSPAASAELSLVFGACFLRSIARAVAERCARNAHFSPQPMEYLPATRYVVSKLQLVTERVGFCPDPYIYN